MLRLRHENQRRFVLVLREMAIDAVVASIELSSDEPLPERRIAGVERRMPVVIPVEQIGVGAETFGEIFLVELRHKRGVVEICLTDEFGGGEEEVFFFPVDGDLGFVFSRGWRGFWCFVFSGSSRRVFGGFRDRFVFAGFCSSLRLRFRFFLDRLDHDEAPFEFFSRQFQPKDDATARCAPSTNVMVRSPICEHVLRQRYNCNSEDGVPSGCARCLRDKKSS